MKVIIQALLVFALIVPPPLTAADETTRDDSSEEISQPAPESEATPAEPAPTKPPRRWVPRPQFSIRCLMVLTALVAVGVGAPLYWEKEMDRRTFPEKLAKVQTTYNPGASDLDRLKAVLDSHFESQNNGGEMLKWIGRHDLSPVVQKLTGQRLLGKRSLLIDGHEAARALLGPKVLEDYNPRDPADKRLRAVKQALGRGLTPAERQMMALAGAFDGELSTEIRGMLAAPTLLSHVLGSSHPFHLQVLEAADAMDPNNPTHVSEMNALWEIWNEKQDHGKKLLTLQPERVMALGAVHGSPALQAQFIPILKRLIQRGSSDAFKAGLLDAINYNGMLIRNLMPEIVEMLQDVILKPPGEEARDHALRILSSIYDGAEGLRPELGPFLADTMENNPDSTKRVQALRLMRYLKSAGPKEIAALNRVIESDAGREDAFAALLRHEPTPRNAKRAFAYLEKNSKDAFYFRNTTALALADRPELVEPLRDRILETARRAAAMERTDSFHVEYYLLPLLAKSDLPEDLQKVLIEDLRYDKERFPQTLGRMPAEKAVPLLLRALKERPAEEWRGAEKVLGLLTAKKELIQTTVEPVLAYLEKYGLVEGGWSTSNGQTTAEIYLEAAGPEAQKEFLRRFDAIAKRTSERYGSLPTEFAMLRDKLVFKTFSPETVDDVFAHIEKHGVMTIESGDMEAFLKKMGPQAEKEFVRRWDAVRKRIQATYPESDGNAELTLESYGELVLRLKAKHGIP